MGLIQSLFDSRLFRVFFFLLFCGHCSWAQQIVPVPDAPADATSTEEVRSIPQRHDPAYEDWRKPELPKGMQMNVDLLDRYEDKTFTRELLHAQWRELDPIDLIVIRPATTKKTPVILYLYSYPSSNDRYKDQRFCEFLTRNGFAAVGFVSALTDQRFHDRPPKDWFVSQLQESLGTTVHDVQMMLNYLEQRGDMDMSHVGMWGDGSGAAIAIMAAAVDPRIKALDLLDPWGDWPKWLEKSTLIPEKERAAYLDPRFLATLENLEPLKALPQLKVPVRLQHIDGVTVTPAIVRQNLEAAAPRQAQIIHYGSSKEFRDQIAGTGQSFVWIQDQLTPAASTHPEESKSAKVGSLK